MSHNETGLKDAWSHAFSVGAAVSSECLAQKESVQLLTTHFSSLTPESAMKMSKIWPFPHRKYTAEADRISGFAKEHRYLLRGHAFLDSLATPEWVFEHDPVKRRDLLENFIQYMCERYGDAVYAWDVINNAVSTTRESGLSGRWFENDDESCIDFAFRAAHAASAQTKLFLNESNNITGKKKEMTLSLLRRMLDRGVPIDGIGLHGHWNIDYPDECTLRTAIEDYAALGLDIEITQLDISAYKREEEENDMESIPEERELAQAHQYRTIFRIASDYPAVKNITTWGIADNVHWIGHSPARTKSNRALLFNPDFSAKPLVHVLIDMGLNLTY